MEPKIIGVGFQKTGTSTLREALTILGFTVCDTKPMLLFPILRNNFKPILNKISRYDAVQDNPWPLIYKDLDKEIPGSKFILTHRESESWYKSVSRHIGNLNAPIHEWIYGIGKGLPKDHKKNTITVYEKHNQEVKEYFSKRPKDFLIVDFIAGDGWEKLCAFLDVPQPNVPFPHYNNYKKEKARKSPTIRRRIKVARKRVKYYFMFSYLKFSGLYSKFPN